MIWWIQSFVKHQKMRDLELTEILGGSEISDRNADTRPGVEEYVDESARRDEDGTRRFVGQMAMLFAEWGFPKMGSRVLVALMTAEEPGLTAGELSERLQASPAAISGAVRYLMHIGLVVRESVPGSRRALYLLPDDAWYQVTTVKQRLFDQLIAFADKGIEPLGGTGTRAGARVTEMRDFFMFAQAEMSSVLARWQQAQPAAPAPPAA
jgi:predicted transcriptional regulator